MSDAQVIIITAGLVASACAILGSFLVVRRIALLGDAVSHAVLPGIVLSFLIFHTRAPLVSVVGAALFAIICVLAIDGLRSSGLVADDAAIGLVFPALFALGVVGIQHFAGNLHLDLDSTLYGEIAFAPFWTLDVGGLTLARSVVTMSVVVLFNLLVVAALWKELKVTSFDPDYARTIGIPPRWVARILLVAVAVTAVTAFEAVGAILVVALLIVPAAAAHLLADRLGIMVAVAVMIGWVSALGGYWSAMALDASIAGAMGLWASGAFLLALLGAPRHGVIARFVSRARLRRTMNAQRIALVDSRGVDR